MDKKYIRLILDHLRCLTLFPKRYKTPQGRTREYWGGIMARYSDTEKMLTSSDYRWYIIEYNDGHRELAYLRVLQGGFFSGMAPAIYRGMIIPRRIGYGTFSHINEISLAF